METVFKVGDRVYFYQDGWGSISIIDKDGIIVDFKNGSNILFTLDGYYHEDDLHPSISFTEYDLVNGGFSQERPMPKIEVDTLVYVRYNENDSIGWVMRYFSYFEEDGSITCFSNQKKSVDFDGQLVTFKLYSLTNPLENESNKK